MLNFIEIIRLEDIDQLRQGEFRKNLRLWDNKYSVAATRLRKVSR